MNSITAVIAAVLCIGIVTLIVAELSNFFDRFNEETRRIAYKMRRAQDSDEYLYWQSRLRRHYIRLLPFISEKTAGRIYSRLFKKPKHCAEESTAKEHSDGLFHILAPSVLSICLCAICLCGMSWAWFTATGNTAVSTIQAATYTVGVEVKKANGEAVVDPPIEETTSNGVTTKTVYFSKKGEYIVTLTANGSASQGYFIVDMGGDNGIAAQIVQKGNRVSFNVKAGEGDTVKITPKWINESGNLPENYTELENKTYTLARYESEDGTNYDDNKQLSDEETESKNASDTDEVISSGDIDETAANETETTDSDSTTTSVADTSTGKENSESSGETEASTESTTETSTATEQNSDTGKTESDSSGESSDTATGGETVGGTPSSDSSSGSGTTGGSGASE